jgi:hypothetical protein
MKFLTLILMMAATNIFAANTSVLISATTDDKFVIVLTQGTNHTLVYTDTSTNWRYKTTTTISIPNNNLSECSIDFITSSHTGVQGLAAVVTGDAGTVYTGNPLFVTSQTQRAGALIPDAATIEGIYLMEYPSQQRVFTAQTGFSSTWGPATNVGLPAAVNWISKPNERSLDYTIHSLPCGAVVKPGLIVRPNPRPVPSPVPVKGDHFACYMLEKGPNLKAEQVTIKDQFGSAKVVLGMPKMICNPSQKIHRRQRFPVENEKRHLVCYEMIEQSPNKDYKLEIKNQFETRNVRSTNRELFCVPSLKKHL